MDHSTYTSPWQSAGGGGNGILGIGSNGAGVVAGSEADGGHGSNLGGGLYGRGGRSAFTGSNSGGNGAVRVMWGPVRSYPNNALDVPTIA